MLLRPGAELSSPSDAHRRWRFANAVFDEAGWQLLVDDRPVVVEHKPLALLRELLSRAGQVVSKDDLLDAVWPDVVVVEASLPTAVAKLRRALGDDWRGESIIATVARVGYRIGVPVVLEEASVPQLDAAPAVAPDRAIWRRRPLVAVGAIAAAAILSVGLVQQVSSRAAPLQADLQREGINAVRRLDLATVERLIGEGWNPGQPVDREDNDSLKLLLNRCEWEPGHDRQRVMLIARTLIDGGASLTHRNVWGDTAYSIAAAPRYCGTSHPVTRMISTLCYAGTDVPGAACEADYGKRRPFLPNLPRML